MNKELLVWAALVVVVAAVLVITNSDDATTPSPAQERYTVVVDAGSSGTRPKVYRWQYDSERAKVPAIEFVDLDSTERAEFPREWSALSDLATQSDPDLTEFGSLINYLKMIVPEWARKDTELHIMATGGMRLVSEQSAKQFYTDLGIYLRDNSPFDVKEPITIEGRTEGLYGWLAANYLMGTIRRRGTFPTFGALDLGGASTQVTFLPLDEPPAANRISITLGLDEYNLYSISILGLGQNEAFDSLGQTPACFNRGYPIDDEGAIGTGNYAECATSIVDKINNKLHCQAKNCVEILSDEHLDNTPSAYGEFLAFSAYNFTRKALNLGEVWSLHEMTQAGKTRCETSWTDIAAKYANKDGRRQQLEYEKKYCFTSALIKTLLNDGFGFPLKQRILLSPDKIQGTRLDWTLGAAIHLANQRR